MRPRTDIRLGLVQASRELASLHPAGYTWRRVADHLQLAPQHARAHVQEMARAGELRRVGVDRERCNRGRTLYLPVEPVAVPAAWSPDALGAVLATWAAS